MMIYLALNPEHYDHQVVSDSFRGSRLAQGRRNGEFSR